MTEATEVQAVQIERTKKQKRLSTRLLIAIPMGLVFLGLGYVIYEPASLIAGMLTDSCSGNSNAYFMWKVWLRYLWPAVMLVGALVPPALVIMNRRWKWVLLSMLAGGVLSIIWYVLWVPVLMLSGC